MVCLLLGWSGVACVPQEENWSGPRDLKRRLFITCADHSRAKDKFFEARRSMLRMLPGTAAPVARYDESIRM